MDVKVTTILNHLQPLDGFVYRSARLVRKGAFSYLEITIEAHRQRGAHCSQCQTAMPGYDHTPLRVWEFVPSWGLRVVLLYAPRRGECPKCQAVVVEHMPWSEGKSTISLPMMQFLGQWARRLSWKEVARIYHVGWASVCRSVEWMVEWGLAHRELTGIAALGIDEIHWRKGQRSKSYLTVIYQIDAKMRRLLWVGQRRTQATLRKGLKALGPAVCKGVRHVCSDMWKPYRLVVAKVLSHAAHVIDRFHVALHLNQAVDEVRRRETTTISSPSRRKTLKKMRWTLLRSTRRVLGRARERLNILMRSKLKTARAHALKESFHHFWTYTSPTWAKAFLKTWTTRALKSRLPPMIKVAHTLREHEDLLLNWIRCRHEIFTGATEGLNNKIRVVTKRSYGFRTYRVMELALYHTLGKLPDPPSTHDFW